MKLTEKQKKLAPWVLIPLGVLLALFLYSNGRGPASLWKTHQADTTWISDHIGENIDTTKIDLSGDTMK